MTGERDRLDVDLLRLEDRQLVEQLRRVEPALGRRLRSSIKASRRLIGERSRRGVSTLARGSAIVRSGMLDIVAPFYGRASPRPQSRKAAAEITIRITP